jgi:hypothetical protein
LISGARASLGIRQKKPPHQEIHAVRGCLRRKPGNEPFGEEWVEYNREELGL